MGKCFVPLVPVIAFLIVGTIILIVGAILTPVFVDILHNEFKTLLPMSNESATLDTWEDPRDSVDMYMKFYFFNLENPTEVAAGGKPHVTQKGPFVYEEIKVKENVTFDTESSTASFVSPRSMAVITMLDTLPIGQAVISAAIRMGFVTNENLFKTLTVYELLWGYKDNLMVDVSFLLKNVFHVSLPIPLDGYFGFFYKKNGTDDGLYTVKTGQDGLQQYMEITEWNHNKSLPYWKTKYCNMINGTDGTMYHPFIEKTESLSIFSSDLCRSINVIYNSQHFLQDVPQYRFKPPQSLFDYPPENEDSACYCVGETCPHGGVLNISACQEGAPVFVSQPHFLNGDYYLNTIDGLNPNETLHNTFIDIEPTTGIVMKGAKRLQMNLAVQRNAYVSQLSEIRTMLYPLLWLEESAMINDKGMETFKQMFFNIQQWITFFSYLLICVGGGIDALTLLYVLVKYLKHRKQQKELAKSVSPDANEQTPLLKPSLDVQQDDNDWAKMIRT
ncbi:SCARB2 [Bugula neritina]|uniref:Scavenger receptor class B member 1 n=1 Tax=Bugula neritina TaxID=10212 RepID=A0A7J7JDU1_BUGNE|nr:SCARB2 [Bugula neritina]